jgi:hypothetical protein
MPTPIEVKTALEILSRKQVFGDPDQVQARKTMERYRYTDCPTCAGSRAVVKFPHLHAEDKGPKCYRCKDVTKIWVHR